MTIIKKRPLVSIITPLYNSAEFVEDTLNSVLMQTSINWEMILVDDVSSDNSIEIIQSFINQDSRIKLIKLEANSGAAVARNVGIEAAQGRYIAFLDSDDLWAPDKLEKQLAFMGANNYPFTYAAYEKIDEHGVVFGHVGVPERVAYSDMLKVCSIGCLTAIYDTEYFGKVFMPLILKRQDFGLWLKLLKHVDYAYGMDGFLGRYRVHAGSISANKINVAQYTWRLYRDVEHLHLIKAMYYFTHYAVRSLLRVKAPGLARKMGLLK